MLRLQADLLANLAKQRLLGRLAGVDSPLWKLPRTWNQPALTNEQLAFGFDHECRHVGPKTNHV